jgi:MFS family permease
MFQRPKTIYQAYPPQFWLLFSGLLISTIGTSMVWPFMTIFVSEQLDLPLASVASLITLNGFVALVASFIAGPITDRAGRKWIMVVSLIGNGASYFLFSQASTLPAFAVLMALRGLFQPLYRVGTNAMVTDLVPPEQRAEAFALIRMSFNVGIAIGPAVGGFIAVSSYTVGFTVAAIALLFFGLLLALFARETVPDLKTEEPLVSSRFGGYGRAFKDTRLDYFLVAFMLFQICSTTLWILLAVYAKQNYQLPESQYGLIATTNALMVVLFQVSVTRVTKHYPPLRVLAAGALVYALGVGSVALGQSFWGFWLSYVVATIGELMVLPTASTYVANLAPADMRGRYMSALALSQGLGMGVSPLIGGLLNDYFSPRAIWLGGSLFGMLGAAGFAAMSRIYPSRGAFERPESESQIRSLP